MSFRYGAGDPEVLSDVNLHVAPGEMVAFVGPSGGGKTTLRKIMMGLLEPTAGVVLVNGHPLIELGNQAADLALRYAAGTHRLTHPGGPHQTT